MKRIAIFASGSGSNAENIVKYFERHPDAVVDCILCNRPKAYVVQRAKGLGIESYTFGRKELYNSKSVLDYLLSRSIDYVVLAGFLWLVPNDLVEAFPKRIVNIHPALLPKYGGKGMYGEHVHEAVFKNKDRYSGITIHYVNQHYDEGGQIFQAECKVDHCQTAKEVARTVLTLEHKFYPIVIESILMGSDEFN